METSPAPRHTSAIAFFVLMLPYGISGGYSMTLAFQLAHAGMTTGAIAAILAMVVWTQTWKVAWAPLVDATLGYKRWHVIGAVATALALLGLGIVPPLPDRAALLSAMAVVVGIASTLTSMSAEGLIALSIEDERRGTVSGWLNAGNLGGVGLGGGLALWLSQHLATAWLPAAALATLCLACTVALPFVHPTLARPQRPAFTAELAAVGRALWVLSASRAGLTVIVLMLMPVGSGAAQNLWAAVAGDWRADGGTVALVNGALGGVASLVGSVIGGRLCDRLDRKTAYCLFGLALCVTSVAMAVLPRTPATFVVMTLVYALVLGACYAAYGAVVLEVIGTSAAATKFQLLASLSNVPIALLIGWDGVFHDRGGAGAMLWGEAAVGVAGILAFIALTRGLGAARRMLRPAAAHHPDI